MGERIALGVRQEPLDLIRFVAALGVLLGHWFYSGIKIGEIQSVSASPLSPIAAYGYLGVYLFFLISGFVISSSALRRTPSDFAVGRLVRLYPAYWVALIVTTVVVIAAGSVNITAQQFISNLSMVSRIFGESYIDSVYWTLFHELVFYIFVFLLMAFGLRHRLEFIFQVWGFILIVTTVFLPNLLNVPLLGGLYAFFAAGAIASTVQRKGWTLLSVLSFGASLIASLLYIYRDATEFNALAPPPDTAVGVVVGFYLVLLAQTTRKVARLRIPGSRMMGNLTYPIYLLHGQIGYILIDLIATEQNIWLAYSVVFVIILLMSWSLNHFVESGMNQFWFRFFGTLVGRPLNYMLSRSVFGNDFKIDQGRKSI